VNSTPAPSSSSAGSAGRAHASFAGIGAVTAYGWSRSDLVSGLRSGVSAVVPTPGYESLGGKAYVAKVADGGNWKDGETRFARALRAVAREAVEDALARGWQPGPNVGLVHNVVLGEVDLWRDFYLEHEGKLSVRRYLGLMPSTPMSTLMQEFDFHGPAMNVSAMCASGNAGLITAGAWLDSGIASDVLVISTDISLTPENVQHFRNLGVAITDLDPMDACRPFQEGSLGFVMGEASVGYVLTRNLTEDARPYGRYLGGSMSHDAHHVTSIEPSLTQVKRCYEDALARAGKAPEEIAYLNAHGPGTVQCDAAESVMLNELLTEANVFSVKPLAGHCQAAAASVELAASLLGFDEGVVYGVPQRSKGHPRLLDGVTPLRPGATLKSSIGMGGHNSAVVIEPC
jgi:3-oxoacyl-[acyl-carrier-protein] synthase II